ncbi:FadR/GntR family transcriptional regulator [Sphingomonas sp. Y38-1Y]|uniref:FadR/GntR family transcriptional regulator n=1 Tax=Sphingomonas sp. Y38-1Y TaxID=3078265 RepID=UPI0028F068D7|nr:FadR/GntR family transcriptional regulator [Sphingomonas sp. Y38-1Y]
MARKSSQRLYAQVAGGIAQRIASGEYPVGRRLPSERDLAVAFGVSRPSIREAIIALEVDGLVEVRMSSGVHVIASEPRGGKSAMTGVGPFELLEARRAIEAEACALAAQRVTDADLAGLRSLVEEMTAAGPDWRTAEDADERFHFAIADATRNSAMSAAVHALWEAKAQSPQYRLFSRKAHEAGVFPRIDEHAAILDALASRDPLAAREAMRLHITRVLESLLQATEVEEAERLAEQVAARRRMFVAG